MKRPKKGVRDLSKVLRLRTAGIPLRVAQTGLLSGLLMIGMIMGESDVKGQRVVAHRGASRDAPENTLAAFRLAWKQGADGIEGDFYLTRDGEVVCIHDKTTGRTADQDLTVADATLAELQGLDVGKWKGDEFTGQAIPTLRQVISTVPEGKWLIIELKAGPEIVEPVRQVLAKSGLPGEQVCIISFNQQTIAAAKRLMPRIKAHWLTSYKQQGQTDSWLPSASELAETVKRLSVDGLGMEGNRQVVTVEFLAELRKRGVQEFHVWTIDDSADAKFFAAQGPFGITTNRPLEIRKALKK
ncbi:MAG: glycerophosphodiester phosphodiesterase [Mariniblastus sp.]|nr:glycerophosphodiester phosphodiesterase [Mariniblastus sp.]